MIRHYDKRTHPCRKIYATIAKADIAATGVIESLLDLLEPLTETQRHKEINWKLNQAQFPILRAFVPL